MQLGITNWHKLIINEPVEIDKLPLFCLAWAHLLCSSFRCHHANKWFPVFTGNNFTKTNNNKFNTSNTFDKNDNKIDIWSTFVMFPTLFIYFFSQYPGGHCFINYTLLQLFMLSDLSDCSRLFFDISHLHVSIFQQIVFMTVYIG